MRREFVVPAAAVRSRNKIILLMRGLAALRFFYGVTLGMAEVPEQIAYAREPRRRWC
jgi:hypothetical protein